MIPIIAGIVSGAASLFSNYQKNKAVKVANENEIATAKVKQELKAIEAGDDRAGELDRIFARGSKKKQTISFIILMVPVVMCFIPGGAQYAQAGFIALESLPEWYSYAIGLVLISIWGFRGILLMFLRVRWCMGKKGV